MTHHYLVRTILKAASGIPRDNVVADHVWQSSDALTSGTSSLVTTPTSDIWLHADGTLGFSLGQFISPVIDRGADAIKMEVYDISAHLDGSPAGSPLAIDTFTMPAPVTSTSLPEEVALVATLRGSGWSTALVEAPDGDTPPDAKKDRPRQRHSGRVFHGPFTASNADFDSSLKRARPQQVVRDVILANYLHANGLANANNVDLAVWSRKDGVTRVVERVEVDNAWDIIRKRGSQATSRDHQDI